MCEGTKIYTTLSAVIVLMLVLLATAAHAESSNGLHSRTEVFAHSEAKSVMDAVNGYRGELHNGRVAYAYSRAEIGWQQGSWKFAALARYDVSVDPSSDFVRLYHLTRNKLPLPVGERFDLQLRAKQYQLAGVLVGKQWQPQPALQLRASLSLLRGSRFLDGTVSGQATIEAENDYNITGRVNYAYEKDELLDRPTDNITGYGASLDAGLTWDITPGTEFAVDIFDLYGRVRWKDAPFTDAIITTDSRRIEDGFAVFDPLLSGIEGNRDFTQRLQTRADVRVNQQLSPIYSLNLRYRLHPLKAVPSIGITRQLGSGNALRWNVEWLPVQQAIGAGINWRGLSLQYTASDLRFDDAQLLALRLGYTAEF